MMASDHRNALLGKTQVLMTLQDYNNASIVLDIALKAHSKDPYVLLTKSSLLLKFRDLPNAYKYYDDAQKNIVTWDAAIMGIAKALVEEMKALSPKDPAVLFSSAELNERQWLIEAAHNDYAAFFSVRDDEVRKKTIYPRLNQYASAIALDTLVENQRDTAVVWINNALKWAPKDRPMLMTKALQLVLDGKSDDALKVLAETEPELNDVAPKTRRLKAKAFLSKHDTRSALFELTMATALAPSDYRNWYFLGVILYNLQRFPEASLAFYRCSLVNKEDGHVDFATALGVFGPFLNALFWTTQMSINGQNLMKAKRQLGAAAACPKCSFPNLAKSLMCPICGESLADIDEIGTVCQAKCTAMLTDKNGIYLEAGQDFLENTVKRDPLHLLCLQMLYILYMDATVGARTTVEQSNQQIEEMYANAQSEAASADGMFTSVPTKIGGLTNAIQWSQQAKSLNLDIKLTEKQEAFDKKTAEDYWNQLSELTRRGIWSIDDLQDMIDGLKTSLEKALMGLDIKGAVAPAQELLKYRRISIVMRSFNNTLQRFTGEATKIKSLRILQWDLLKNTNFYLDALDIFKALEAAGGVTEQRKMEKVIVEEKSYADEATARVRKGLRLMQIECFDGALMEFRAAVDKVKDNLDAHYFHILCLAFLNRDDDAYQWLGTLMNMVTTDKKFRENRNGIAKAHLLMGMFFHHLNVNHKQTTGAAANMPVFGDTVRATKIFGNVGVQFDRAKESGHARSEYDQAKRLADPNTPEGAKIIYDVDSCIQKMDAYAQFLQHLSLYYTGQTETPPTDASSYERLHMYTHLMYVGENPVPAKSREGSVIGIGHLDPLNGTIYGLIDPQPKFKVGSDFRCMKCYHPLDYQFERKNMYCDNCKIESDIIPTTMPHSIITCPTCLEPTKYVTQYQKYFCETCNKWL